MKNNNYNNENTENKICNAINYNEDYNRKIIIDIKNIIENNKKSRNKTAAKQQQYQPKKMKSKHNDRNNNNNKNSNEEKNFSNKQK